MSEEEQIEDSTQNEMPKDGKVLRRLRSKNTAQWGLNADSKKKRPTLMTRI